MSSANVECVKRFVLGPGDHADDLRVSHDDTVEKRVESAVAEDSDSSSGDARIQAVLDCLHPDIVIHIPASMPYGGDHVGHEGFLRMGEAMNATWEVNEGLDMSFVDLSDDEVICFVSFIGTSRHTGRQVPMRMVERYRMLEGKIVDIELFYWDTAAIVEATGAVKTIVPA